MIETLNPVKVFRTNNKNKNKIEYCFMLYSQQNNYNERNTSELLELFKYLMRVSGIVYLEFVF